MPPSEIATRYSEGMHGDTARCDGAHLVVQLEDAPTQRLLAVVGARAHAGGREGIDAHEQLECENAHAPAIWGKRRARGFEQAREGTLGLRGRSWRCAREMRGRYAPPIDCKAVSAPVDDLRREIFRCAALSECARRVHRQHLTRGTRGRGGAHVARVCKGWCVLAARARVCLWCVRVRVCVWLWCVQAAACMAGVCWQLPRVTKGSREGRAPWRSQSRRPCSYPSRPAAGSQA